MSVPGARPKPRSIRSPCILATVPYCSATMSGAWLGSMTPPEPSRCSVGGAGAGGMSGDVELAAGVGVLWCWAYQSLLEPHSSASRAEFMEAAIASLAVEPSEMATRLRMHKGIANGIDLFRDANAALALSLADVSSS